MTQFVTLGAEDLQPLEQIEAAIALDPLYLDKAPYPIATKSKLRRWLVRDDAPRERQMDDAELYAEIADAYDKVKLALSDPGVEGKDKAAVLKSLSELLTKLVALREKQLGVREQARFQKTVIEVLEEVLEPHQRTLFIEKLGHVQ
ncbi:MAG: hypothetical protein LLG45_01395 [Actinomycetia bacterium]|nr:hypothetical protein [Actinomycetes bacterium]